MDNGHPRIRACSGPDAMGQIYATAEEEQETGESIAVTEDLKEISMSFGNAVKDSVTNLFSTSGIASIAAEQDEEQAGLIPRIRGVFTPLSAYAFMAFVLLYMPCVIVLIAMRHEFKTWEWAGVAFAYQTVLAWVVALVIYQGEDC